MKYQYVFLSLFVLFITSCSTNEVISNAPPQTMDEFTAEAMIVAAEDRILMDDALVAVARAYPHFDAKLDTELDKDSFFAPPPRFVKFINCTDIDGINAQTFGKAVVTYKYGGKTRRRTFSDSCYDKTDREYYCSGARVAVRDINCSGTCWEDRYCK